MSSDDTPRSEPPEWVLAVVIANILRERDRQDEKWGAGRTLSPEMWLTILMEEVGEAAKAALEGSANYPVELTQVAAVAIAAIESYDGGFR